MGKGNFYLPKDKKSANNAKCAYMYNTCDLYMYYSHNYFKVNIDNVLLAWYG